jgi:hypothetical protein
MPGRWFICCCWVMVLIPQLLFSQRVYKAHSVLSGGNFYKVSVSKAGMYKIDIALLSKLGVSASNLPSASVRIFGNGGGMLPETNSAARVDDLEELAIQVMDGGDGVLNGADYILFYAPGPDQWLKDSARQRFVHQSNIYSNESTYFLSIGGAGRRVGSVSNSGTANVSVNSFSERYFHENDTVNFLSSGKQWYGEEFADMPGKSISRSFNIPVTNLLQNGNASISLNLVARSTAASRFDVKFNAAPSWTNKH